ncbi:MAG: hypothetical protein ACK5EO_16420 [Planctomycetota bacterium]
MTQIIRRHIQTRPLICIVALAWTICTNQVWGFQPPEKPPLNSASTRSTFDLTCVICHSNPQPITSNNPIGLSQARVYLGEESDIATQDRRSDIHARAIHKVWQQDGHLTNEFRLILEKLKNQNAVGLNHSWASIDPEKINDKDADPVFLKNCLTCHAGIQADSQKSPMALGRPWEEFAVDRSAVSNGSIGCEACHGRGSEYLTKHLSPNWLTYSPLQKQAEGFRDLENSAVSAQVCLSCHLGSPSESKIITHEMYAAGHPPLPPFDLAKFLDETCKKHWIDLTTKSASLAKTPARPNDPSVEYLRKHFESPLDNPLEKLNSEIQGHFRKTQQSRVGQVMASLMSQDLMLFNAESQNLHGDYGVYDCVGCHQTLYKQIRGSYSIKGRVPGRPLGLMWTRPAKSNLVTPVLAPIASFQKLLDDELNKTPFGSPADLQKVFSEFAQQRASAKDQLIEFANKPLNQQQADAWLFEYLKERQGLMGNEWVAKQVFWTLENYFDDLERVTENHSQSDSRNEISKSRFAALAKTAPEISLIVSCGPAKLPSDEPVDYAKFYKHLKQFVEELVTSQAGSASQTPAQ